MTALLLAAVALPATAFAQETVAPPVITVPSQTAPAPAPVAPPTVPAPVAQTPPGQSQTTIAPGVAEQAAQEARERAAERRAAAPRQQAARPAPVATRATAPAPAPAPEVAVPVAAAPAPVTPPVAEPAAPVTETQTTTTETVATPPVEGNASLWLILAGLGLAAAAIAAFLLLRRRREDEVYQDYVAEPATVAAAPAYDDTPVSYAPPVADPVAAAPLFTRAPVDAPVAEDAQPALEHATLTTPDAEDIDAVLGGAEPQGARPQLEIAMRPMRAGVNRDEAVVEFELTVANAGGAPAQDVRIGAFMLTEHPGQTGEIERMLIDPPADHVVPAETIAPGDGTRLDAALTLPRDDLYVSDDGEHEGFTPVLVADARYRLPDGSEGRTAAAFIIGRVNGGEALVPIAMNDDAAMYADIEARLHSVAAKV